MSNQKPGYDGQSGIKDHTRNMNYFLHVCFGLVYGQVRSYQHSKSGEDLQPHISLGPNGSDGPERPAIMVLEEGPMLGSTGRDGKRPKKPGKFGTGDY